MLCAVDYTLNLLCAFNSLQPMKKFVFAVASRATGSLQIKPSVSGNENGLPSIQEEEGKNLYMFYISHFVALTRETIIKNRVQVKFEPYFNRKQCGEKPVLDGAFR